MNPAIHENLHRDAKVTGSSDRAFGLVFAAVFAIVGAWPMFRGGEPRPWAFALGACFLAAALARPAVLAPLNRVWFRVGMLLHRVTSPLVLGLIFFGAVAPTGLVMRLLRRRPLALEMDHAASSYWVPRDPPGPAPDTMTRQF